MRQAFLFKCRPFLFKTKSLVFFVLCFSSLCATNKASSPMEEALFKRIQGNLDFLRHELENQTHDMNLMEAKFQSQQDAIEALKDQMDTSSKKGDKALKGHMGVDQKLQTIEASLKALASDFSLVKKHMDEDGKLLDETRKKMKSLEIGLSEEKENMKQLKSAVNSLLEAFGSEIPEEAHSKNIPIHEVKNGESIGLIAQKYKISSKQIKELNNLKSDMIFVGQKLKIPKDEGLKSGK